MRPLTTISDHARLHMKNGTTDLGVTETTNPVSSYTDQARYNTEVKNIIRKRPIPVVAAAKLSKAYDYIALEVAEIPIIVFRNSDGQIKTFLNVCRHRGARLVVNGEGHSTKEFTCPFHGWNYKCGKGLTELKTIVALGMVWVILYQQSDFDLKNSFDVFSEDFAHLGVHPQFPLDEFIHVGHFNWKIAIEAFLEVDHFPFAHAPYLTNLQFPGMSLADAIDRENHRIVVPLKKPSSGEFVLDWAQVMYFIFPCSFFLFYKEHVTLLTMIPLSVDKTEFRYIPLVGKTIDLEIKK